MTIPTLILVLTHATLSRLVNICTEGTGAQVVVSDITQLVYQTHNLDGPEVVACITQARDASRVMIFRRTRWAAQRLAGELQEHGFPATAIHGDLNQIARECSLKKFRAGTVTILVVTNIAARGIDIIGVSHVISYEYPDINATHVRRIGRTDRMRHTGIAVTLIG